MSKPHRHQILTGTNSGFTAICPEHGAHHTTRMFFIVRGYGKNAQDMVDWQERMERILAPLNQLAFGYTEILFLIPAEKDNNFALHNVASTMTVRKKPILPISVIQPEDNVGQPWTRLLNAGIVYASKCSGETANARIIPMSFETDLNKPSAELLADCLATETNFIGQRLMPKNVMEIPIFSSPRKLLLNFVSSIKTGIIPKHEKFLQLASCHRNTFADWTISLFRRTGMFNPACNLLGGMEDIELLLRAMLDDETNRLPGETTIFYDDIRISQLEGLPSADTKIANQRKKLENEIVTLNAIWHWLEAEWIIRKGSIMMNRSPYDAEFNLHADLWHAAK